MQRNEAWSDRIVRLIAGVMLLGLYGAVAPPWKYVTLVGLVLIATAITGNCPVYSLFGVRTSKRQEGAHP
ncbi:MAG TPA: DUF2892 domain-containing protein [Gemmatimonadales bacterium]|nr:DUF2892 domain-containing protein [Gemmatimonadales bacterium]